MRQGGGGGDRGTWVKESSRSERSLGKEKREEGNRKCP